MVVTLPAVRTDRRRDPRWFNSNRGAKRPVDGNADCTARCDIGALEHGAMAQPTPPPAGKLRVLHMPALRKGQLTQSRGTQLRGTQLRGIP